METHPKTNSSRFRTIELRPGHDELIKPAELIDIVGASSLTLSARRLYNSLIAHAFGPDMAVEGHEWTISLAELRGTHKGNERIEDSILALMKTIVTVRLGNPQSQHGTDLPVNTQAPTIIDLNYRESGLVL